MNEKLEKFKEAYKELRSIMMEIAKEKGENISMVIDETDYGFNHILEWADPADFE